MSNGDIKVKLFLSEKNLKDAIELLRTKTNLNKELHSANQSLADNNANIMHLQKTLTDLKNKINVENINLNVLNKIKEELESKLERLPKILIFSRASIKKLIKAKQTEINKLLKDLEIDEEVLKINEVNLINLYSTIANNIGEVSSLKGKIAEIDSNISSLTVKLVEEYSRKTNESVDANTINSYLAEIAHSYGKKTQKKSDVPIITNAYMEELDYE